MILAGFHFCVWLWGIFAGLHVVLHSWQHVKSLILTSEKLCPFGTCPRTRNWFVWASKVLPKVWSDLLIATDSDESWHTQPTNGEALSRPPHAPDPQEMAVAKTEEADAQAQCSPMQPHQRWLDSFAVVWVHRECRLEISVGYQRRPWNCVLYILLYCIYCIILYIYTHCRHLSGLTQSARG